MAYKYKYLGNESCVFVGTVQKNAYVGGVLESDVPINHPLLELVVDNVPVKLEVDESKKSAVVPEPTESPVSADESKENQ